MNRRRFLAGAALGGVGLGLSHLPGTAWPQFQGVGAAGGDYRALVCIFLFGGNDSFNMVVPRSPGAYRMYAASRGDVTLPAESLLPIAPLDPDGDAYGLHPAMPGLQKLFAQGACAIVANVGALVQPVTRAAYQDGSAVLPPQLFSHQDQQEQWQTVRGRSVVATGWAGRIADALAPAGTGGIVPVNVSLAGTVLQQAGAGGGAYALGTAGAGEFEGLEPGLPSGTERRSAFEGLLESARNDAGIGVYGRGFAAVGKRAITTSAAVNAALARTPVPAARMPASALGAQLSMAARLIAARDELRVSRQIVFVAAGGYDTHDRQAAPHAALLGDLSACLGGFHQSLAELGIADRVVAFTQSDFGRTLTSNGDGTDHGWGGHQLVIGDAVRGQRIFGAMPRLEVGGPDDAARGRIIPGTSIDQYVATLARWFGVPEARLEEVAPQLGNFPTRDLGFV